MNKSSFPFSFILATVFVLPALLMADEVLPKKKSTESSVSVECHGRLRHGVVAIGGECTGTTITFQNMSWELQLPDESTREFAARQHKQPVVVTGTLRKIEGTETRVRWIVDVTKLTEADSRDRVVEAANVTLRGTVRAALSETSETPELSVHADDQIWQLDFSAHHATLAVAESFIGQTVLLTGSVLATPSEKERDTVKRHPSEWQAVSVKTIKASTTVEADSRFFK